MLVAGWDTAKEEQLDDQKVDHWVRWMVVQMVGMLDMPMGGSGVAEMADQKVVRLVVTMGSCWEKTLVAYWVTSRAANLATL